MFFLGFIIGAFVTALIMHRYISSKTDAEKAQLEQEHNNRLKSERAAKDAIIADLENKLAHHNDRDKSFSSRWQQLIERERKVEEREQLAEGLAGRLVAERECELERRERNLEDTVARKVAEGIKGREVGINKNWKYLRRKERVLREYEHKILKQAQVIADHLGVPLRRILAPREKKLVDQSANELTGEYSALREEHYALIDLVMSCPENQLKDMLASMQRFDQSWPGSPPPPPESEN